MDFDLARREKRLAKGQATRRAAAQKRSRQRSKEAAAARAAAAEIEAKLAAQQEAEARAKEAAEAAAERHAVEGGGILWTAELRVVETEGEDDKILLPVSALEALSAAGALSEDGALAFRLHRRGEGGADRADYLTHCGVREFTAAEGTVGLPVKVRRSLLARTEPELQRLDSTDSMNVDEDLEAGDDAANSNTVALGEDEAALVGETIRVRFVRLPKAKYVRLSPVGRYAVQAIPDVRAALEYNFNFHATVTTGDVVQIWHRGRAYDITVAEVKPRFACSLLDTDVDVDIDEFIPEEQAKPAAAARGQPLGGGGTAGVPAPAAAKAQSGAAGAEPVKAFEGEGRSLRSEAAPAAAALAAAPVPAAPAVELPAEPVAGDPEAVQIRIRVAPSQNVSRRFRRSDPLGAVFAFVAQSAPAAAAGGASLVRSYPRTRFTAAQGGQTLDELKFGKREALIVEMA
eukprot:CAMPEP_0118850810 /NCGR_PEP_ID=MMETSP1163-20130328/498_1 /TAXON_ID=124430 /ORGANISM="Phaeomonas parva, Strain CCMP2877" /LENGTH=459 /DNA_ID=CAMNT_0006783045 /DNA_START=275 /DNA_END=1654 /DNA_ORIENTATION=-